MRFSLFFGHLSITRFVKEMELRTSEMSIEWKGCACHVFFEIKNESSKMERIIVNWTLDGNRNYTTIGADSDVACYSFHIVTCFFLLLNKIKYCNLMVVLVVRTTFMIDKIYKITSAVRLIFIQSESMAGNILIWFEFQFYGRKVKQKNEKNDDDG